MVYAGSGTLAEELLAAPDSLSGIKFLPPANEVELLEIVSHHTQTGNPLHSVHLKTLLTAEMISII